MKINQKEGQDKLPSFFETLNTTINRPLESLQKLEELITKDVYTQQNTEGYRIDAKIDRMLAKTRKQRSHGICPSIQFMRTGKKLEDFGWETYWLMLDYDHLTPEQVELAMEKVKGIRNTMAAYRTISGKGIRILCRYTRPKGCPLAATDLHHIAITKAMKLYDEALGLKADRQCTNMTRICGLAHDENAYFQWDATAIDVRPEETEDFIRNEEKKEEEKRKPPRKRKAGKGAPTAEEQQNTAPPNSEEIIRKVEEMSKNWYVQFETGHRHEFVMQFATFCHNYGARKEDVEQWMTKEYAAHDGTQQVIDWVYNHTESQGCWSCEMPRGNTKKLASTKNVMQWLETNYDFRHNTITNKLQLRGRYVGKTKYYCWTDVEDSIMNSIFLRMEKDGIRTSTKRLNIIVNSEFSADYNPMEEYLKDLPPWQEGDPDYIAELARKVTVIDCPNNYHTEEEFIEIFKKWFVGMIVEWTTSHTANQAILIFVGKGGIFKTTFFERLLPPSLREYFANDSAGDYKSKEFLELIASKGLVLLDEFGVPHGKNLNSLKSSITKMAVTYRIPYHMYSCQLKRNASFCATSNNVHIIPEDESRRYMTWHIRKIENPYTHPFNYEGIYSQAVALARKVLEKKKKGLTEDDWKYWLTDEEIKRQSVRNKLFQVNDYIAERILKFYKVPDEDTPVQNIFRRRTSDILERICTNSIFRDTMSNRDISQTMQNLGFQQKHEEDGNKWIVSEILPTDRDLMDKGR